MDTPASHSKVEPYAGKLQVEALVPVNTLWTLRWWWGNFTASYVGYSQDPQNFPPPYNPKHTW